MKLSSDRLAHAIFVIVLLLAIGELGSNAVMLDTWMDEGKYLMKGYWYVTGQIRPYSEIDPTYYMPLVFYADGIMQWMFGFGYIPGRTLMIVFSIACLVLVYLVGQNIGRSRVAGVAAVILVASHSVTLIYFATATPYAMVSCLSLLLIHVLLVSRSRPRAFIAAGVLLWALIFTRPDMLPIAIIPAGWALLIERQRKLALLSIAFLAFTVPSVLTVLVFGKGLLDVVLDVPGISQIAGFLGAPAAPISGILPLTTSPLDPVIQPGEIRVMFLRYFLKPYAAVAIVTSAMIALRIIGAFRDFNQRHVKPIDLILSYFWITTILHFIFSLSYCVDCIIPYTNYFLPVGALAAAALVGEVLLIFRGSRPAFVTLGCMLAVGLAIHASPAFPTLLRPGSGSVRNVAERLSAQLKSRLPTARRVMVLSGSVAPAQAVWLAGGVIEPRSLYLTANFREPRAELPENQRVMIDDAIWNAGFWSEESMRHALTEQYTLLLVERRNAYTDPIRRTVRDGIPFGDTVGKYFRLIATAKVDDLAFELYQKLE